MSSELSPVSGFSQLRRIESSKLFQGAVIAIIILSALTIGAKTYDVPPLVENVLTVLDNAITLFFLVEILFRFGVCENKKRFRVFRVLRLVSVVPELRFLINSLLKAIPRMGYIALLMFIIFYIYAAMGSMFFAGIDEELWGDVAIAMLTLFRVATFEDWTDVMYATMESYPLSWIYYLTFIFLTAFVFLNMMIGAILEVMSEEQNAKQAQKAHDEREDIARQLAGVQHQLAELTRQLAENRRDT